MHREKDAQDGATGQEMVEDKEKFYGYAKGGCAGGWCDRGQDEMGTDDPLWRPLT